MSFLVWPRSLLAFFGAKISDTACARMPLDWNWPIRSADCLLSRHLPSRDRHCAEKGCCAGCVMYGCYGVSRTFHKGSSTAALGDSRLLLVVAPGEIAAVSKSAKFTSCTACQPPTFSSLFDENEPIPITANLMKSFSDRTCVFSSR